MRTLIRRFVVVLGGLSLLAAPITVVGGTLEHRHAPRDLASASILKLRVGRVSG